LGNILTVHVRHQSREREIKTKDSFSFRKDFKNKLFRIKINAIQMKETVHICFVFVFAVSVHICFVFVFAVSVHICFVFVFAVSVHICFVCALHLLSFA